jgi:hypothetical protein
MVGTTVAIFAAVTEPLTGVVRNTTHEVFLWKRKLYILIVALKIVVYSHDVKMEIEKQGDSFKPGNKNFSRSFFVTLSESTHVLLF